MSFRSAWLRLSDGRRLTYAETGASAAFPVVYCHGAIGTPLGHSVDMETITSELGIRHIAISRPGLGTSDPVARRTVAAFAADVRELADALALERFAVVGVSAGGPYALAIAAGLPERVSRVALCSSLSPLCPPHATPGMRRRIRLALAVLAAAPATCAWLGDAAIPLLRRHPALLSWVIAAHAAPAERHRVRNADERAAASASFLDAGAAGVHGMIDDYLACSRHWGFDLGAVEAEVDLWHGLNDPLVPVDHALQLAIAIPRCRVFVDPAEGHHFFRARLSEILAALVGHREGRGEPLRTTIPVALELANSSRRRSRWPRRLRRPLRTQRRRRRLARGRVRARANSSATSGSM